MSDDTASVAAEECALVGAIGVGVDPRRAAAAAPLSELFVVVGPDHAPLGVVTANEVLRAGAEGHSDLAHLVADRSPGAARTDDGGLRYEFDRGFVNRHDDALSFMPLVTSEPPATVDRRAAHHKPPGFGNHPFDNRVPGEVTPVVPWTVICRRCQHENKVTDGDDQRCAGTTQPMHDIDFGTS